jgi:LysR family nitrogen assimilation transcriptional regulator
VSRPFTAADNLCSGTHEGIMDLAGLRLFVQVAEAGSLSRAATGLETTQPAISRRIAAFEQAWGGRLFHRTGRGVMLTDLGERVLPCGHCHVV